MKRILKSLDLCSHWGRLSFILFAVLLPGCMIKHTVPEIGPSCEFEVGPDHQKKGISWVSMKEGMCKVTDGVICKTEVARILVTEPAEIDLTRYKNIAFADIKGNAGADFSAAVMEEMVKNRDIRVLDRTQLAAHLKELGIAQEDLFDQTKQMKLGKMLPGTVLVLGEVSYEYKESQDRSMNNCGTDPRTRGLLDCHKSTRTGQALVKGRLHFTETETGRQIQVKRLSTSFGDSSSVQWGSAAQLNAAELQDLAIKKAADEVVYSIVPTPKERHVIFYKASDVPRLARGIAEAQAGKLENAKKIFSEVIVELESSPSQKEDLAAAKFNLGVIKTYERRHEEAERLFSEVDDLAFKVFPAVDMRNINECLKKKDGELKQVQIES